MECAKHELLQPFSVLHEKEGECLPPFMMYDIFFFVTAPSLHLPVSSVLRRVCSAVQVHGAADGQRASQNHQRTFRPGALQVRARSSGSRAKGKD